MPLMTDDSPPRKPAGTALAALGVLALVGYGVLGASPEHPGLPTAQLALAALLVVTGIAMREGRGPRWIDFAAGALVGALALDLLNRLLA